MKTLSVRYIFIIGLLAIFALIQGGLDYRAGDKGNPLKEFPVTVGKWMGQRLPVSREVCRILGTEAVTVTSYRKQAAAVVLSIVYYSDEKVDFHSPEGCSVGKGDFIERTSSKTVNLEINGKSRPLELTELVIRRADATLEILYYFFKTSGFMGAGYAKFRYHLGLNFLRTGAPGGALIIIRTPVSKDIRDSESALKSFMESFYPEWLRYL